MLRETTPRPAGPRDRRRRRLARRWLSAGLTAAAAGVAVSALAPPQPATRPVLVATRDLPAGAALTVGDVRSDERPSGTVPDGALDDAGARGAVLSGAVRRGEVLTDARTTGAGLLAGQPPGTLATTVAVGDPAVLDGLRSGARVDVLARTDDPVTGLPTGAERVASDVVVLAVPTTATGSGFLGAAPGGPGSVLVAVDPPTAARLAAASGRTVLALRAP
ncbi:SAF domain-containing protein [Paenibacillus sp. TRM 82003]|uniref:SAF domain-containing protein n=1 Tax=Kineococcus sp. TRM81007 TaxID=2925831 RepID=UPI001F58C954|nr:SAF domain-containing protein [Kineococcus sp. TRM81007]MCI2239859.1 SAF domain-containing protein [Kineococcus sp. TRM81007]MCI3925837.1 SAF domain-containing protein [Paenibacillus sp. TRM 82003]